MGIPSFHFVLSRVWLSLRGEKVPQRGGGPQEGLGAVAGWSLLQLDSVPSEPFPGWIIPVFFSLPDLLQLVLQLLLQLGHVLGPAAVGALQPLQDPLVAGDAPELPEPGLAQPGHPHPVPGVTLRVPRPGPGGPRAVLAVLALGGGRDGTRGCCWRGGRPLAAAGVTGGRCHLLGHPGVGHGHLQGTRGE